MLVAEDNTANRGPFEEQFKLLGCEVDLSEGGTQACAMLASHRYDVLVTDLTMPGMDGYALARRARSVRPDMPVIAATACVTEHERQRCDEAGIARVLTKPLPLAGLELALQDVCGHAAPNPRQAVTDTSGPQSLTGEHAFSPALLRGELHASRHMLAIFRLPALAEQRTQFDAHLNQLGVRGSADAVSDICDNVLAAVTSAIRTADGQPATEHA